MIGGMDKTSNTIKDCWILDINEKSWTKVCHVLLLYLFYDISYILFRLIVSELKRLTITNSN